MSGILGHDGSGYFDPKRDPNKMNIHGVTRLVFLIDGIIAIAIYHSQVWIRKMNGIHQNRIVQNYQHPMKKMS